MSHRGIFRAFLSIVPATIAAAALLGSTPAHSTVTIDIPCSGTWTWAAATKTLSCTPDAPPADGSPSCSLAVTPSTLPAGGGPLTLIATCTNSPTGYTWSASPATTFTGGANTGLNNTNGATISASTTFTVTATNGSGSGQASKSVQVGAVAGAISCPGYSKTIVVNWNWGDSTLVKVDTWQTQNGLGTNGILVVPFIPTGNADNVLAQLSVTNYPASQMVNTKRVAISTQPCDLNPAQVPGSALATVGGSTPTVYYVLGDSPPHSGITGKPTAVALTPGQQYYINVAERQNVSSADPDGTQSCVPGGQFYPACELRLSLGKPPNH